MPAPVRGQRQYRRTVRCMLTRGHRVAILSDLAFYTSLRKSGTTTWKAVDASARSPRKQANMRPVALWRPRLRQSVARVARAIGASAHRAHWHRARIRKRHWSRVPGSHPGQTWPKKKFLADPEFARLHAPFAQNCATFAKPRTRRARRGRRARWKLRWNFRRKRALEIRARDRQCSSFSISSAYASGSSSSSESSARLLGLTTKIQPSPNASSLIVSGFSASALLTDTTLPETGA